MLELASSYLKTGFNYSKPVVLTFLGYFSPIARLLFAINSILGMFLFFWITRQWVEELIKKFKTRTDRAVQADPVTLAVDSTAITLSFGLSILSAYNTYRMLAWRNPVGAYNSAIAVGLLASNIIFTQAYSKFSLK